MKHALIVSALVLAFVAPVSAASKPTELSYSITDNRRILSIYYKSNPDSHMIAGLDNVHAPANEGWFRLQNGFMPYTVANGIPLVADTKLYIPDTSNMVATDAFQGGFLRDQTNTATLGALVVSNGAGPGLSISGVYNSTAPAVANGTASSLQLDANGALIFADGGKTYVVLNQANVACTNLFTLGVRVVEYVNPGIAQIHPFVLYDENAANCTGFSVFGNTHPNETTGPLLGAAQYIHDGIRTTNGLSVEWFGGGVIASSVPFIQVQ
jgi:hypothetical protein